jgi:uncharacterized protein
MAEPRTADDAHLGGWTPPGARARREIIERSRTVAIVGASSNPARASNFVATYLLSSSAANLDVFMVNPSETEILGQPVYAALSDLPVVPDIVDVFRRPADLPDVARAVVEVGSSALWIQLGLWSDEAARIGHEAGIDVVMNRCLKIEHARFHGGLHLGGFVTGIIDSRR